MKDSTFKDLCKALLARGYLMSTVLQVAEEARVSKSTAHRFFTICEQSDNIYVEDYDGKFRRVYAKQRYSGQKVFLRGIFAFEDYKLAKTDIVIRHGES